MTILAIADGVNELALGVFAVVLAIDAPDHLLGVQAHAHRHRVLGREPRHHRPAERLRDRRRLPVGVDLPRLRRAHLPVRLDGWVGLAAAGASFLPVVLLLAERMRNAGKFTIADVLAFRLASARRGSPPRSARSSSRSST